jgi:hypothetical protein
MRFLLPLALALALLTGHAAAYNLIGAGADTCGAWTADRRDPTSTLAMMNGSWVTGFLSGIGYAGADWLDPLQGLHNRDVLAWMDTYCQAHPLESISRAAGGLAHEHPHH